MNDTTGLAAIVAPDPVALSLARLEDQAPSQARRVIAELDAVLGLELASLALADEPAPDADALLKPALDALLAVPSRLDTEILVWLDHLQAPKLTQRHPIDVDALLWSLRARQRGSDRFRVILSTHTALVRPLTDPDSAFYGDGEWVQLDRPDKRHWVRVALELWQPSDVPEMSWLHSLLAITDRHSATTLIAFARAVT